MKTFTPCRRRVLMTVFASVNLLLLAGELAVCSARAATLPKTNIDDTPLPRDSHPTTSYAPIIKKVSPSVVNIYTSKTLRLDPAVRQYLREMYGVDRVPSERRQQSLGSGIIVSQDGYILPNNHVVEGADEVKVALPDEKTVYDLLFPLYYPHSYIAVVNAAAEHLPS